MNAGVLRRAAFQQGQLAILTLAVSHDGSNTRSDQKSVQTVRLRDLQVAGVDETFATVSPQPLWPPSQQHNMWPAVISGIRNSPKRHFHISSCRLRVDKGSARLKSTATPCCLGSVKLAGKSASSHTDQLHFRLGSIGSGLSCFESGVQRSHSIIRSIAFTCYVLCAWLEGRCWVHPPP